MMGLILAICDFSVLRNDSLYGGCRVKRGRFKENKII